MKTNRKKKKTAAKAKSTRLRKKPLKSRNLRAKAKTVSTEQPRNMTFLTIARNGEYSLGVKTEKGILDVQAASKLFRKKVPADIHAIIKGGDQGLTALVQTALASKASKSVFLDEAKIECGPCITNPEKIICLGFNYRKHAQELSSITATAPVLFSKFNNALSSHNSAIKLPVHVASKFDYEVELVAVIGKTAYQVSEADALSCVFGYCIGNDISARDLQFKTSQFLIGKSLDGFAPIGPYLVTADQIPVPDNLNLECFVNGEQCQAGNTNDMIFSVAATISYVSQYFTLKPGDIIFTGTPDGVISGMPAEKQVWLKSGDSLRCVIEKLGELKFSLV